MGQIPRPKRLHSMGIVFRSRRPCVFLVVPLFMSIAGHTYGQVFNVQPRLDTRLTYSDNIDATSTNERSAWIVEVSPSIRGGIGREGGRVSTRFNLGLSGFQYSTDEGLEDPNLLLDGVAEVEAVEDLLFIEMDASIRRDNLSTFSGRSSNNLSRNTSDDETRSFGLAPRLEFALGSYANATVRYRHEWFSGGGDTLSRERLSEWRADVTSARAFGPFGWMLNYERADTRYGDSQFDEITEESLRATLTYALTPQVQLRGIVGREDNDFGLGRSDRNNIVGAGFDWFPTPRTSISATAEDRFFGTGYDVSVSHRRARSSFQLAAGRDVQSSRERFGSVFQDPFFNAFFNDPSLIALLPDDLDREDFVRDLLGLANDSFLSNAFFETEYVRATYTLSGVRNSVSFSVFSNDRSRVASSSGLRADDVFLDSDRVESSGGAVSFNRRLGSRSTLNANVTRTDTESTEGRARETRRYVYSVGYSTNLGARSVAGLTYRHERSDGTDRNDDFTENVISANFGIRF
ncbi:TIGR03016 family PEP-CTERM system-associated outer membrane protein [Rhodocyclaceae bacterium SMB388]